MLALLFPNQRFSLSTSELVIFQLQSVRAVQILPYTHTDIEKPIPMQTKDGAWQEA